MQLKHIIFDMDGLLVDSEKVYTQGWFHSVALNQVDVPEEAIRQTVGRSITNNKQMFYDYVGDWDLVNKISNDRYAYFYDQMEQGKVTLMPYTLEVLNHLKQQGYTLSLASSSFEKHATTLLAHLNLSDYFANKIFGDQVPETKPSPEIYKRIVAMSGFHKDESVVLEDSLTGVRAGLAADMRVIWIPAADINYDLDMDLPVFKRVQHLKEALEIIGTL